MEMGSTCKTVVTILFLLVGVMFLFSGLNSAPYSLDTSSGDQTQLVVGVLIVLIALAKFVHIANLCPMCKGK